MRIKIRFKNIKQLLHFIDHLNSQQKKVLQTIIRSMDYTRRTGLTCMPSWIRSTKFQWANYLDSQENLVVQIIPQAGMWIQRLKSYFLNRHSLSINVGALIKRDSEYRQLKKQRPLLATLLVSRIVADHYRQARRPYHSVIDGLVNLAEPQASYLDQSRDLKLIYYNLTHLFRYFNPAKIDLKIIRQSLDDIKRTADSLKRSAEISKLNSTVTSLLAHHTYSELNQMASAEDQSFQEASTGSQFINHFLKRVNLLKSSQFNLKKRVPPKLYNKDFDKIYQSALKHPQLVHFFLKNLTKLNASNRSVWMKSVAKMIRSAPNLRGLSSGRNIDDYRTDKTNRISDASYSRNRDATEADELFHYLLHDDDERQTKLFCMMLSRLTSRQDYSHWRDVIRFVKNDLESSQNLNEFVKRISNQIQPLSGRITDLLKYYISIMKRFSDNRELNVIYVLCHKHFLSAGTVLDNLASLNQNNRSVNLKRIAETIDYSALNSIHVLRLIGNRANKIATQINQHQQSYLNARRNANEFFSSLFDHGTYISSLFKALVTRLTNGEVQSCRNEFILAEYDFNNSRTFDLFVHRIDHLISDSHGRIMDILKYFIRLMVKFNDNPQLNRIYRTLRKYRKITLQIMENMRTLDVNNQYHNLDQITKLVKTSGLKSLNAARFLASAASKQIPLSFRKSLVTDSTARKNKR